MTEYKNCWIKKNRICEYWYWVKYMVDYPMKFYLLNKLKWIDEKHQKLGWKLAEISQTR